MRFNTILMFKKDLEEVGMNLTPVDTCLQSNKSFEQWGCDQLLNIVYQESYRESTFLFGDSLSQKEITVLLSQNSDS